MFHDIKCKCKILITILIFYHTTKLYIFNGYAVMLILSGQFFEIRVRVTTISHHYNNAMSQFLAKTRVLRCVLNVFLCLSSFCCYFKVINIRLIHFYFITIIIAQIPLFPIRFCGTSCQGNVLYFRFTNDSDLHFNLLIIFFSKQIINYLKYHLMQRSQQREEKFMRTSALLHNL